MAEMRLWVEIIDPVSKESKGFSSFSSGEIHIFSEPFGFFHSLLEEGKLLFHMTDHQWNLIAESFLRELQNPEKDSAEINLSLRLTKKEFSDEEISKENEKSLNLTPTVRISK